MSSKAAPFVKAIASRRTVYSLKPVLPEKVELIEVKQVVQDIIKHTPTCFNSQGNRAIILSGESHKRVWDYVYQTIPIEKFKARPLAARDEAIGTVVFLVNDSKTKELQEKFPVHADLFPELIAHSSGSAQLSTWTALELLGFGANLQHFNDLIKAALPKDLIKDDWSVQGQLVFGLPVAEPGEKTFIDNEVPLLE
ncbi:LAFA_0G01376g1_1 [Lachancea sp. 'fantastica']|nr:LAFA_0G01376g1_1 [Lachancea sp. 'fantastica']